MWKKLGSLNNLGGVYNMLENYVKALEYNERALEGKEKPTRKTHPSTLITV